MTPEQAYKILHPDTTREEIARIREVSTSKDNAIEEINQACIVACEAIKELSSYKQAEADGLLIKLPCKVGDTIYDISEYIYKYEHPEMYIEKVNEITIQKNYNGNYCFTINSNYYNYECFGKTVFLTQKEAEQALKERESNE